MMQASQKKKDNEEPTTLESMIVDILIHLGYFLDINDVRNLGMVSKYFQQTIANMYQHSFKIFNCNSINPATENEWRFVLKKNWSPYNIYKI